MLLADRADVRMSLQLDEYFVGGCLTVSPQEGLLTIAAAFVGVSPPQRCPQYVWLRQSVTSPATPCAAHSVRKPTLTTNDRRSIAHIHLQQPLPALGSVHKVVR